MLPVISLQTDRYKHDDYGWIDVPLLRVERMEDSGGMVGPGRNGLDPNGGEGAKVIGERKINGADIETNTAADFRRSASDLNDEVPF